MSDSPSIPEIDIFVDPFLNGVVIEGLLCGVYSVILVQAVWELQKKANKGFYSVLLILMWICVLITFSSDWAFTRAGFVINNSSPFATYAALTGIQSPFWDIPPLISLAISDAILIWRCHVMWRSRFILFALVVLLASTISLMMYDIILPTSQIGELVGSLGILSSFISTVSATFLIALKIVLVTRRSHMRYSYSKVVAIIVESGALVSTVLLCLSLLLLIPYFHMYSLTTTAGRIVYQMGAYFIYMQGPITGIGPTLIAFRVAAEPAQSVEERTSRTSPISRLTFRRTTRKTNTDYDASAMVTHLQFRSHLDEQVSSVHDQKEEGMEDFQHTPTGVESV